MDWGDVGKTIAGQGLTILGTALGGPLGGVAGKLVGSALGLGSETTPEEVKKAIDADPAGAKLKLLQLQEANRQELALAELDLTKTAMLESSRTDRAWSRSEDKYVSRCRPTGNYCKYLIAMMLTALVFVMVFYAPEQLPQLPAIFASLAVPLGLLEAGSAYYNRKRSHDKALAAGQTPPPPLINTLRAAFGKGAPA